MFFQQDKYSNCNGGCERKNGSYKAMQKNNYTKRIFQHPARVYLYPLFIVGNKQRQFRFLH